MTTLSARSLRTEPIRYLRTVRTVELSCGRASTAACFSSTAAFRKAAATTDSLTFFFVQADVCARKHIRKSESSLFFFAAAVNTCDRQAGKEERAKMLPIVRIETQAIRVYEYTVRVQSRPLVDTHRD